MRARPLGSGSRAKAAGLRPGGAGASTEVPRGQGGVHGDPQARVARPLPSTRRGLTEGPHPSAGLLARCGLPSRRPLQARDAGCLRGLGAGLDAKPAGPPCPRLHVALSSWGPLGGWGTGRKESEDRGDLPCSLPTLTSGQRHRDSEQEFRTGIPHLSPGATRVPWLEGEGLGHCSWGRESGTGSWPRSERPTESLPQGRVGSGGLGGGRQGGADTSR